MTIDPNAALLHMREAIAAWRREAEKSEPDDDAYTTHALGVIAQADALDEWLSAGSPLPAEWSSGVVGKERAVRQAQRWAKDAAHRDTPALLSAVDTVRLRCNTVLTRLTEGNFVSARGAAVLLLDAAAEVATAVGRVVEDMSVIQAVSEVAGLPRDHYSAAAESVAEQVAHAIEGEG